VDWIHLAEVYRLREGAYEHNNEHSGLLTGWEFLDHLSNYLVSTQERLCSMQLVIRPLISVHIITLTHISSSY
jgi:hypothetical protein